ncbi:MAG: histidine phosphatase family protein [Pseudomonadota bacterium]
MMTKLIFITHPEVEIDPDRPITDWKLAPIGRARTKTFASHPLMSGVTAIWSSTERKAFETAEILAAPKALGVRKQTDLGENDRSATGFLPRDAFEAAADAFFTNSDHSFRGWERAVDAQDRVANAVRSIVANHKSGDLAIASHGAVGTLLWCHLMALPIDRCHDQPSQGHYWCADLATLTPSSGWQSIG